MSLKRLNIFHFLRVHSLEVGVILFCASLWVMYVVDTYWAASHQRKQKVEESLLARERFLKELERQSKYQEVPYEARHDVQAYVEAKFNHSCYEPDPDDLSRRILRAPDELEKRGCKQRLPQAITFGGRKCGSANIVQFLRFHPAIEMRTSLLPLDYFSGSYKSGLGLYRKQMPYTTQKQLTVEKTPEFFVVPYDVPKKVFEDIGPTTKIIAVVCDPVKRIITDYVNLVRRDKNPEEIEQYLSKSLEDSIMTGPGKINHLNALVDGSLYFKHFMRWLHLFPLEQIFLIDADVIKKHPSRELQRLENFLGIQPFFEDTHFVFDDQHAKYCLSFPQDLCIQNKGQVKSKEKKQEVETISQMRKEVPEQVKKELYDFFEPYDKMLSDKFNQSLSWRNNK